MMFQVSFSTGNLSVKLEYDNIKNDNGAFMLFRSCNTIFYPRRNGTDPILVGVAYAAVNIYGTYQNLKQKKMCSGSRNLLSRD